MLRFLVLSLLLINGLYFAWRADIFPGLHPDQQTEPQRLQRQIRPEALRLITGQELRRRESTASGESTACLQAGPFDEVQSTSLRSALAAVLPPTSWTLSNVTDPVRWIVYMGTYANPEALEKKRSELASLNLRFEPLTDPALQWGLSLGGFETQAAANAALISLSQRGVRTARVLQEHAPSSSVMLRLPVVDQVLRARLPDLTAALGGKVLMTCK